MKSANHYDEVDSSQQQEIYEAIPFLPEVNSSEQYFMKQTNKKSVKSSFSKQTKVQPILQPFCEEKTNPFSNPLKSKQNQQSLFAEETNKMGFGICVGKKIRRRKMEKNLIQQKSEQNGKKEESKSKGTKSIEDIDEIKHDEAEERTLHFRKKSFPKSDSGQEKILKINKSKVGNKYFQKNWTKKRKQEKITSIQDISEDMKKLNSIGQIIFIWDSYKINEKWAKGSGNWKCFEIHDGTNSMMVIIPEKELGRIQFELKLNMWIKVKEPKVKKKYPNNICLLVTAKTTIMEIQAPKGKGCEPEIFGITISDLQSQNVGSICNLVCMVLEKGEKQFVINNKGGQLVLAKIKVYDPIENKALFIKLWEEKTEINFFCQYSVYLLKGIQVKQYKGERYYDVIKDFTYRELSSSEIIKHLSPYFYFTETLLSNIPSEIKKQMEMDEQHNKKQVKLEQQKGKEDKEEEFQLIRQKLWQIYFQKKQQLNIKPRVSWEVKDIRIDKIILDKKILHSFSRCVRCRCRGEIDWKNNHLCFYCGYHEGIKQFCFKFQFSDQTHNFEGEIRNIAASKMLSVHQEQMPLQFFDNNRQDFQNYCLEEIKGNIIRGVLAKIVQKINSIEIKSYYLVDILPFDEGEWEQAQEEENDV